MLMSAAERSDRPEGANGYAPRLSVETLKRWRRKRLPTGVQKTSGGAVILKMIRCRCLTSFWIFFGFGCFAVCVVFVAAYFDEDPFAHSGFQQFVVASLNLSDRWESMLPDLAEHRVDLRFQRIYLTVCWQSLLGTLRNWALLILTHVGYPSPIAGIMNLGNNSWRQKKGQPKNTENWYLLKSNARILPKWIPEVSFYLTLIIKF